MKYFILISLILDIISQEQEKNLIEEKTKIDGKKPEIINLSFDDNEEEDDKNCHFINLTNSNFDSIVQKGEKNRWLIFFYADKCPFCKPIKSKINKLINEGKIKNDKIRFGKVNLNAFNLRLQIRFNVTKIPYTILIDNNNIYEMSFLPLEENIIKFLESENLDEYNNYKKEFPINSYYFKFIYDLIILAFSDGTKKINKLFKRYNYTNIEITPLQLFTTSMMIGVPLFAFIFLFILDCLFPYKKNDNINQKEKENNKNNKINKIKKE